MKYRNKTSNWDTKKSEGIILKITLENERRRSKLPLAQLYEKADISKKLWEKLSWGRWENAPLTIRTRVARELGCQISIFKTNQKLVSDLNKFVSQELNEEGGVK